MAPLDPQQLLKALNELLGPNGEISGSTAAVRVASLMKDANKLVSKCVYINILKVETPGATLEKLLSSGGWETLNKWLQETKDDENYPFLIEILKVYQLLPVTVDILKTNNAAKSIKQLCKADNESVKTLASNIFDEWMKKVKGNNNNDDKSKKKKKEKEKGSRDKDSEKKDADKLDKKDIDKSDKSSKKYDSSSSSSSGSSKSSKSRDSKHSHHHDSHRDQDRKKISSKKMDEENLDSSSNDSGRSEDKVIIRKGDGLKLHIRLGGDKDKSEKDNKTDDTSHKRPSTVKRPPSKFRSTGLEEETVPTKLAKNADLSKPIPKRIGSDIKSDLPSKRSRPNMPPPLTVPAIPPISTGPTSTSPQSPSETHGKIRLIPARPKSNHEIHESTGFMDSLTTSSRTYGAFKKKRRLSGQMSTPPSNKGQATPTTPSSPVSPTAALAKSLPSVPSFYKDTQEDEDETAEKENDVKTERSPSPADNVEENSSEAEKTEVVVKKEDVKTERSPSPIEITSSNVNKESKGLLTTGATKVKKKRKSVTWKQESEIKEIFYFEMDEDERVNVNRSKDFNQAKKDEMIHDRRCFESSIRMKNDRMTEQRTWYRPKLVTGHKVFEYGKESIEKGIQKLREQGVLQALFFNKDMIPDNPIEPDTENEEPDEPKVIPIDDMSGGEEFLYNYETHPQSVQQQKVKTPDIAMETNVKPPFSQSMPPQQPPPVPGPLGLNLPPGVQLPPDLANILTQIQSNPSNNNDPVIAHVQQILNNLMCGGTEQSYEQLQQIQHIMNSQMGLPPDGMMQGPPPGMPMMGMNTGAPPPMGPRTLLGAAPPGYLNPRQMGPGPGPNRFGPPGPGPQGNWGPPGNMGGPNMGGPNMGGPNMGGPNMGGPNMGRQNMGGPNRGGPQGNFGGRMRGPSSHRGPRRGRGKPFIVCRHYANGSCRIGNHCSFLHPGENGPPKNDQENMDESVDS